MENAVGFLRQWIIIWFGNRGLMCLVPPVPWGGTGGVWWLFRFGLVGLVVGVGGFASHVGAFELEVTGGSGDAAEGAVGDEFAADAHVPLLGFALAGDERGSRAVAGLHDLEDEDAVGGGDRGGVLLQCLFDRFGSVFPQCEPKETPNGLPQLDTQAVTSICSSPPSPAR